MTGSDATKFVYDFSEGNKEMKDLLGGKGANLAEMTGMGLPVPPGFTITTQACLTYLKEGGFPAGLMEENETHLQALEAAMGKHLGDDADPLLVSVRSGAKFSMPGMMDTVLNLGLNDRSVQGLAKQTSNERFAWDAYRRFVQMFGKIVLDIDAEKFEERLDHAKEQKGEGAKDTDLDADDLRALTEEFKGIIRDETGRDFPEEPRAQLEKAIEAVFRSWNGARAVAYRRQNKISDDLGTAVNVVAMVFGNMGDDSGTGVVFTRNPATGEKEPYGDYLPNAQGEDVVAGIRNTLPVTQLKDLDATSYEQLLAGMHTLENHYRDMCDIEFTIERGKLWFLQTRIGKRTSFGEWVMAYDMLEEGLITQDEGLLRLDPNRLEQLFKPVVKEGQSEATARHPGTERVARRGGRARGVHGGRRRRVGRARRAGDPGAPGDHPRRLPRDGALAGHPDQCRRDELARGGRRSRRGHPGGVRRRPDPHPAGRQLVLGERAGGERGRLDHDRRHRRVGVRWRGWSSSTRRSRRRCRATRRPGRRGSGRRSRRSWNGPTGPDGCGCGPTPTRPTRPRTRGRAGRRGSACAGPSTCSSARSAWPRSGR